MGERSTAEPIAVIATSLGSTHQPGGTSQLNGIASSCCALVAGSLLGGERGGQPGAHGGSWLMGVVTASTPAVSRPAVELMGQHNRAELTTCKRERGGAGHVQRQGPSGRKLGGHVRPRTRLTLSFQPLRNREGNT